MAFTVLSAAFPVGMRIGIKNPYLKLSIAGNCWLRNDNPSNIIMKYDS